MKKLITVVFLFLGISVFAQERGAARAEISQDEMATLRAKRLVMQLDLNTDQEEKLKKLFAKRIEANKELKEEIQKNKDADRAEKAEMRKERMEMNEEQKAELREILTEEQYIKWEQLQEKRRKGRKAPMRERKN
ncbi:hypothetical protein [Christiangramia sp. SM2212]|uniref:DUF4890 domain-containing protein n=1 Tax=Christiangramia sediminicola TaxID=3073267 RepID=A0ABU1EUA6_9FLAO|nr:hypothetical protein [Christiangramia sp. SM2212]MDR5591980.1 hypothetical protein [Christiangramia sp. SM2212]